MAAEDLLINDSSNGEAVKAVSEGLPQLNVEPALAWWSTQTRVIGTKLICVLRGSFMRLCEQGGFIFYSHSS